MFNFLVLLFIIKLDAIPIYSNIGGLRSVLEILIEFLSLEFELVWFEQGGNEKRLRSVTFSESRPYENMLRKEYIQQKKKGITDMELFTIMPVV